MGGAPEIVSAPRLQRFDSDNFVSIRNAFHVCEPVELEQAWRPLPQQELRASFARLGWNDDFVFCFVEAKGAGATRASADNQRLWELGDTIELFMRPPNSSAYFEFHLSCEGHRLQLQFPDDTAVSRARESGDLSEFLLGENWFEGRTFSSEGGWSALFGIPIQLLLGRKEERKSGRMEELVRGDWRFSVCRYDYGAGGEPVLSSTSALTKLDFHRIHEWRRLSFEVS